MSTGVKQLKISLIIDLKLNLQDFIIKILLLKNKYPGLMLSLLWKIFKGLKLPSASPSNIFRSAFFP